MSTLAALLLPLLLLSTLPQQARAQSVATFGGTSLDQGYGVAIDALGNAVVAGYFFGTVDFDPGAGVVSRTSNGSSDVYVARYAADGTFVSVVTVGGTGIDRGYGVSVDASGNAVVTGYFSSVVDFDPGVGVVSRSSAGSNDVFVARYAADGTFVSVATVGGTGDNQGLGVAVDASGDAVVTGYFTGTVDFDPDAGVVSRTGAGAADVFVARFAADGALVSVATFGSPGADVGQGVSVDALGNAVVAGYFSSAADFDPGVGVVSRSSRGSADAFVARYAADGTLVSVATFGATGPDIGQGVAVDASGNAVVAGYFSSVVDFDPGVGVVSRSSAGSNDVFVARYAADGSFVSVVAAGGTGADIGQAVAVDASGNAVVTGSFTGTVDFDPDAGVVSRTSAGNVDVFVARYAADGTLVSIATLGASGADVGQGVSVDASGNAVVTGYFNGSVDFDPGVGVVSRTSAGGQDAFVARYTPTSALLPVELVAFAATADGRTARLTWTTESETNNAGFSVEHQTATGAWTDAAPFISGHGTTTERHDYTASVENLTAGRHTFRLRQTDTDGASTLSAAVTVEIGTAGQRRLTVLANGSRAPRLRVESGSGDALTAEVYDVLGRRVLVVFADRLVAGTVEVALGPLVAGAYVVRVASADGQATSHAVVVR